MGRKELLMFGEKTTEWHSKLGKEVPVIKTPKYEESRDKAKEIINKGVYGVTEGDFWILKNATKTGKIQYTGLIISHAGCLKINDALPEHLRVDPECFSVDKNGWGDSLVYTYCNKTQGIYEVGEVNSDNIQMNYPYAMAFKRCFDRVVLKITKLNYAGIYSEVEAAEFAQSAPPEEPKPEEPKSALKTLICEECGAIIMPYKDGDRVVTTDELAQRSIDRFGKVLCIKCARKKANEKSNS